MKVSEFDFALPPHLIADRPAVPRDAARLLVVGNGLSDRRVGDLPGLLQPGDLLVVNDTRVIAARLLGRRGQARRVIWLGFACNLLLVAAIALAQALPAAGFWDGQAAFDRILGAAPRLLLASFLAYLVGEFANAYVLAKMKIATRGRWLWTRTIGSTLVGQALDSAVFITLAFAGIIPLGGLVGAIVTQWLAKTAYEALATPVTYLVVGFLKRREQLDVYDRDTRFNPLLVAD